MSAKSFYEWQTDFPKLVRAHVWMVMSCVALASVMADEEIQGSISTPDGTRRTWHSNGKPQYEWEYQNGVRHGMSRSWQENGEPFSRREYVRGQLVSDEQYRDGEWETVPIARDLFSFSALLSLEHRIKLRLYVVRYGSREQICTHTMMRSPLAMYPWLDRESPLRAELVVTMTEKKDNEGVKFLLQSKGATRTSTGSSSELHIGFDRSIAKCFVEPNVLSTLPHRTEVIAYVEGDRPCKVDSGDTVERFAAANEGNFLVVVLSWYVKES